MKKICALVIGHKSESPGAKSSTGITEFDFNDILSRLIEQKVKKVKIKRVYRDTYQKLPKKINALSPDFIVSLHCNYFWLEASGTETLYYWKSEKGKRAAEILQRHLVSFLQLPDRGIKPTKTHERGGYLLQYTNAPAAIAEPFFISNDKDLARAQENIDGLAQAYAAAIEEIAEKI